MTSSNVKKTPLYHLHQSHQAKMTNFAGYQLPIHYPLGVLKEHLHTRAKAGLFDVSHMGQLILSGPNVVSCLESIFPIDAENMAINTQAYTVLLNESGGIVDDLIITRMGESRFFIVVNAACKSSDISYISSLLDNTTQLEELTNRALLALQGPCSIHVIEQFVPEIKKLKFMNGTETTLDDCKVYLTRSGYTGEDGFEISVESKNAESLAQKLLEFDDVSLIGLGARDSLRLESGLCLYGHDLNSETTPSEANINFAIAKSRRSGGIKAGGFPGADKILSQLDNGINRKRVGFIIKDRAPVREGAEIQDDAGKKIGIITSGGVGISIDKPIAMGYIDEKYSSIGTELNAIVRGKPRLMTVSKMPFIKQNYFRG